LHSQWNFGMLLENNKKAHWGEGQMKTFLVAFLFLVGLVAEASACFPSVPHIYGQTVEGRMTVKAGQSCVVSYTSLGGIDSQILTQRPAHGSVDIANPKFRYRPAKGYVGSDVFTVAMHGRDPLNKPTIISLRVLVTVTP
jgi:hypothetical protein